MLKDVALNTVDEEDTSENARDEEAKRTLAFIGSTAAPFEAN